MTLTSTVLASPRNSMRPFARNAVPGRAAVRLADIQLLALDIERASDGLYVDRSIADGHP